MANRERTVTVDEVMAWGPCDGYPRERVEELWAGRRGLTALEILDLKAPGEDRLWAVLRNEFFTDAELRELACDYAESVIGYYERGFPGDDRPRNAIRVAGRFARGDATRDELSAARSAAWSATDAARSAALSAAWSAADVARGAALSAAWSAADAAWSAAWSAADAAWSAALSAASAAWSATWSAANAALNAADAAGRAARSAVLSAAGRAADAAVRAAWNEQMEKQIELARQVLRGKKEG
jgi:hypothetical protein